MSVDDLISDQDALPENAGPVQQAMGHMVEKAFKRKADKRIILNLSSVLVWFVALLAFVVLSSFDSLKQYSCLLFFYAIPANAKNKEAAWEFISYIAGLDGQKQMMQCNMVLPNQKTLAYSDDYLTNTKNFAASNRIIAAEMSEHSTVGDWAYVEDGEWISDWSNVLNTKVRNGKMTLEEFFDDKDVKGTDEILKKYSSKKYTG